jgi:hypothetical protein
MHKNKTSFLRSSAFIAFAGAAIFSHQPALAASELEQLRAENAELRERLRLRDENAALRKRLNQKSPEASAQSSRPQSTSGGSLQSELAARGIKQTDLESYAADMPVKAAVPVVAPAQGGWYFSIDGMYEQVRLPPYTLGLKNISAGFTDVGPSQTFDPRLNGGRVRGAIGYMPLGSNWRFELGGSFVGAKQTQSQSGAPAGPLVGAQLLNGNLQNNAFNCDGVNFVCGVNGQLTTDYSSTQLNVKAMHDWRFGGVTVTPSAALFGGFSRADQTLTQAFLDQRQGGGAGPATSTGTYSAYTNLHWLDVGARAGLNINGYLGAGFSIDVGGWIGLAARNTSLNGKDVGADSLGALGFAPVFAGASTISVSDITGVFLANAEAGLSYRFSPWAAVRGFVGVNYDDKVPGISRPLFAGSIVAPTALTPAGIFYQQEMNWYAGAGILVNFGGPVMAKY